MKTEYLMTDIDSRVKYMAGQAVALDSLCASILAMIKAARVKKLFDDPKYREVLLNALETKLERVLSERVGECL